MGKGQGILWGSRGLESGVGEGSAKDVETRWRTRAGGGVGNQVHNNKRRSLRL